MNLKLAIASWFVTASLAVAAGVAATFGNVAIGLGPLLWPLLRLPYDETYPEAPTERFLWWICAVIGIAIGVAVFVFVSRRLAPARKGGPLPRRGASV
jgi:hypothetical protein